MAKNATPPPPAGGLRCTLWQVPYSTLIEYLQRNQVRDLPKYCIRHSCTVPFTVPSSESASIHQPNDGWPPGRVLTCDGTKCNTEHSRSDPAGQANVAATAAGNQRPSSGPESTDPVTARRRATTQRPGHPRPQNSSSSASAPHLFLLLFAHSYAPPGLAWPARGATATT